MSLQNYVDKKEIIEFPNGILGFEAYTQYIALPVVEGREDILQLCSVENSKVMFIVFNPFVLNKEYCPQLKAQDLQLLDVKEDTELSFFVVGVIQEEFLESTVNLKCPLAINPTTKKGYQVVLDTEVYGMRHSLCHLKKEGQVSEC